MEQFMNKMYELYLDMLQDTNANARLEERYDTLINTIFNNLELNWDKTGLRIKDENKIVTIIQAIEPQRYNTILNELLNKNLDEYECGK